MDVYLNPIQQLESEEERIERLQDEKDEEEMMALQYSSGSLQQAVIDLRKREDGEMMALQYSSGSLQQAVIDLRKREDGKSILENILDSVGYYLKSISNKKYKVIGGRAVTAWLNPEHEGLTDEDKKIVKESDWDIAVYGKDKGEDKENNEAFNFTKELLKHLEDEYNIKFEERLGGNVKKNDVTIYQIGIDEGNTTIWFVDVHAEENIIEISPYDKYVMVKYNQPDWSKTIVELNGINYINLKQLIESFMYAMYMTNDKFGKRLRRKNLLYDAIQDINNFNPVVKEFLCKECYTDTEEENITGYKLKCEEIKVKCKKEHKIYEEQRKESEQHKESEKRKKSEQLKQYKKSQVIW
jgi:hypothetical protein